MNAKYTAEAVVLLEETEANNRQTTLRENKDVLLSQISSAIEDITLNGEWNDTFYRHILAQIVVYEDNKLDIRLNLFPAKWRFSALSGDGRHFDASLPCEASKWRFQFAGNTSDRKRLVLVCSVWAITWR
jgi:hypothetical protein